jgi:Glyoxalase-like domain
MLTGIDHVVVVVQELERAMVDYRRLGFMVVPGGRHATGTHNALVGFADGTYLELLAFREPSPRHRWWPALLRGGGLVDFCAATDDLEGDIARMRRIGVMLSDPRPMSRLRPDGHELQWQLAVPTSSESGLFPFLIHDVTPRRERLPSELRHDNGVVGLAAIRLAVEAVQPVADRYRALLGEAAGGDGPSSRRRIQCGAHVLELVEPGGADPDVSTWLSVHGPSPCGLRLVVNGAPPERWSEAATCGVKIDFQRG